MNKMLKFISVALVCASVTASAWTAAFAAKYSFTDISDARYSWCADQIQDMFESGLITGYEDDTYRPDNEVTRQECLALFARAMGSGNTVNEPILKLAHELYDETIETYGLTWGKDEIAYLMYRGALRKADLDTYLKDSEKSKPMKRYEAAVIITKAMGGEKAAAANASASLGYADAATIPSSSRGYVKYAMDKEIMTGMDNNNFSPLTSVLRSQIAVMLSRTVEKTDYSFVNAKLTSINTDNRTCVMKTKDGKTETVVYTEDTVMNASGVQMIPANMPVGLSAIFTYSGDDLLYIDTTSSIPDEVVTGRFMGYGSSGGIIAVYVIPAGENTQQTYTCTADVAILYEGTPATIRSFAKEDSVELSLVDGKVETITGMQKTETIQGAVVREISLDPKLTMTISHADSELDGNTYPVSNSVIVTKNSSSSDFSNIYVGDTVTLTIEYGEIVRVNASARTTKSTGTIKSITIAAQPSMVVSINGKEDEYIIPTDVKITVNGKEGTLYDFRVGDSVTLTIESQAITAISATSTQITSGSVAGVVTAVNSSYGFITVQSEGSDGLVTVFCRDDKATFISDTGKTLKMSNIKEGDTVDVRGTVSNGAFVATLVIVTSGN